MADNVYVLKVMTVLAERVSNHSKHFETGLENLKSDAEP
jgi:hypothetical protein